MREPLVSDEWLRAKIKRDLLVAKWASIAAIVFGTISIICFIIVLLAGAPHG